MYSQNNERDENQIINAEKMPLFLVKLWNIVEDTAYSNIIRWDENGYSFHIMDPYSFCKNVLPQFFKHNNLNSLIRQLNMYGFRKITPIDRSSLARAESDQDHLEFSHPYFHRDHPELLTNIKRKQTLQKHPYLQTEPEVTKINTKELSSVFGELKQLRERQKNMDARMSELAKENEMVWTDMAHIRGQHLKQQQIVNKLIQILVALVQPNKQRLGKRHMYVLDDYSGGGKRSRVLSGGIEGPADVINIPEGSNMGDATSGQIQPFQPVHSSESEALDRILNEIERLDVIRTGALKPMTLPRSDASSASLNGPIIAELDDSPAPDTGAMIRMNQKQASAIAGALNTNNSLALNQPKQITQYYDGSYSEYVNSMTASGVKHGKMSYQGVDDRQMHEPIISNCTNQPLGPSYNRITASERKIKNISISPTRQISPIDQPHQHERLVPTQHFGSGMLVDRGVNQPLVQARLCNPQVMKVEHGVQDQDYNETYNDMRSTHNPDFSPYDLNTLGDEFNDLLNDNYLAIQTIDDGIRQNWDNSDFEGLLDLNDVNDNMHEREGRNMPIDQQMNT